MIAKVFYRFTFYFLMLLVLVLSLLPIEHPSVSPNDKINHLIAYTSLMVFGYLAQRRMIVIACLVIGWGVLIELLQGQTSYRILSYADVLANSAGVLLGCAAIVLAQRITAKRINKVGK